MAIKLLELRKKVQSNFKSLSLIKENLDNFIEVYEASTNASLKKVTIKNAPIDNCWIFNNESGEKVFISNGKKVENTIIYLDKENKKLYLFMIELKSTLDEENLIHCRDKFQDTLSHISVYLLLNSHNKNFEDIEISPLGIICYNKEIISSSNIQNQNEYVLINDFQEYIQNSLNNFLITMETLALGRQVIPVISFENNTTNDNFSIDFNEIINRATCKFKHHKQPSLSS